MRPSPSTATRSHPAPRPGVNPWWELDDPATKLQSGGRSRINHLSEAAIGKSEARGSPLKRPSIGARTFGSSRAHPTYARLPGQPPLVSWVEEYGPEPVRPAMVLSRCPYEPHPSVVFDRRRWAAGAEGTPRTTPDGQGKREPYPFLSGHVLHALLRARAGERTDPRFLFLGPIKEPPPALGTSWMERSSTMRQLR